jgi:hypothetical protein
MALGSGSITIAITSIASSLLIPIQLAVAGFQLPVVTSGPESSAALTGNQQLTT